MPDQQLSNKIRMAVRIAIAGSAVAAFGVASAQQGTPQSAKQASELEEVVITGSRIAAAPNQVAISPVIAIDSDVVKQSGATRVEDLINQLPQVFASQGAAISNGSDGTANVDLRGLLPKRTLVLINGRRLGPGGPLADSDLNQIPADLVERVEVLTGGASSSYGADAVAGVVNFTLNNHFEGFKFIANSSTYQHHNNNPQGVGTDLRQWNIDAGTNFAEAPSNFNGGGTKDFGALFGFNAPDDRGNVTAYATYRKVAAVLQSQFDYSACSLGSGFTGGSSDTGGHFTCSGSSTSIPGRFRLVSATGQNIGGSRTLDANNQLTRFGNANRYNFGPLNYYQRPDERWTAGALAHYQLNDHADLYTEIAYLNDRTVSQIAPSGAFYGSGPYKVNCANPYFSTSMVAQWCGGVADPTKDIYLLVGRRDVEGAARQNDLEHTALRYVFGSKGAVNDAWTYDVYGQLGITQLVGTQNDDSTARIRRSLDARLNTSGNIVCQSTITGADSTCVPWNIWQRNSVSAAASSYIKIPLLTRGEVQQKIVSAETTGDLGRYGIKLPTANSGVKVNVGVDWSQLNTKLDPDLELRTGDGAGQGAPTPPVNGTIIARELFLESRVPLVDEKPGAYSVAFETGYRYSDYNLGFNTNTYKFGVEWSPIRDIRLRGSYARAVRAPNAGELFQPRFIGLDGSSDSCAGAAPAFTLAQCAAQGVTAAQYGNIDKNPASQYNGRLGGDPKLQPETATTTSFGVGWTPSFLQNLRVQVDYFDIKIDNTIQRVGPETTQALCSNRGLFCDRIHRDANGSLWISSTDAYVDDPLANQGALRTKGVDLDMAYTFAIGAYGKIRTGLVGTYLQSYELTALQSLASVTKFDCAGFYGNSCNANVNAPLYKWRHTLRTTWTTPWRGLDVTLAWRYLGSVKLDQLSSDPNLGTGGSVAAGTVSSTDARIKATSYLDLTGSIDLGKHVNARVGINNVLDKSPPVIGNSNCAGCNGNVYSQTYDTLGRFIFGTLSVQF